MSIWLDMSSETHKDNLYQILDSHLLQILNHHGLRLHTLFCLILNTSFWPDILNFHLPLTGWKLEYHDTKVCKQISVNYDMLHNQV